MTRRRLVQAQVVKIVFAGEAMGLQWLMAAEKGEQFLVGNWVMLNHDRSKIPEKWNLDEP